MRQGDKEIRSDGEDVKGRVDEEELEESQQRLQITREQGSVIVQCASNRWKIGSSYEMCHSKLPVWHCCAHFHVRLIS